MDPRGCTPRFPDRRLPWSPPNPRVPGWASLSREPAGRQTAVSMETGERGCSADSGGTDSLGRHGVPRVSRGWRLQVYSPASRSQQLWHAPPHPRIPTLPRSSPLPSNSSASSDPLPSRCRYIPKVLRPIHSPPPPRPFHFNSSSPGASQLPVPVVCNIKDKGQRTRK